MEDKRNTDSVVQEIMEEVRMYGAAWFVSGQQSISDKDALYFESKAQGHLLEIQSKLRELVEQYSVREPLSVQEIERESLHEQFHDGVRFAERKHNIINTNKE